LSGERLEARRMQRSKASGFTALRGWLWLLVESELKRRRIRSQRLLSFSTASFISLRCVSALGVSVTWAILPFKPIRKLTRRAMFRSAIFTP
jgi:hypothetical protein